MSPIIPIIVAFAVMAGIVFLLAHLHDKRAGKDKTQREIQVTYREGDKE